MNPWFWCGHCARRIDEHEPLYMRRDSTYCSTICRHRASLNAREEAQQRRRGEPAVDDGEGGGVLAGLAGLAGGRQSAGSKAGRAAPGTETAQVAAPNVTATVAVVPHQVVEDPDVAAGGHGTAVQDAVQDRLKTNGSKVVNDLGGGFENEEGEVEKCGWPAGAGETVAGGATSSASNLTASGAPAQVSAATRRSSSYSKLSEMSDVAESAMSKVSGASNSTPAMETGNCQKIDEEDGEEELARQESQGLRSAPRFLITTIAFGVTKLATLLQRRLPQTGEEGLGLGGFLRPDRSFEMEDRRSSRSSDEGGCPSPTCSAAVASNATLEMDRWPPLAA
mmetsp:Transcript_71443/g.149306  ORF Transcript_71443/g.149306 Transcript_71443/m.149306 type:complete len:337 (-) Transcript_71443:375-1385(-)